MKADVLVAGAGPVGLTMASELTRYGLSVRIVDKNPQRTDKSKAIVVWQRTLELLDRMGPGIAEHFVKTGLKADYANIFAGGERIAHVDLSDVDTPYNFVLLIQQSETERLLEDHLAGFGVKVEREVELMTFEQNAGDMACVLRHADGGTEGIEVSWLIGCDGAHSTVRHGLGIPFEGSTMLNDWLLADVHVAGVEGPSAVDIHWHSEGILALFPLGGTRYRVIADAGKSASSGIGEHRVPTLQEMQRILDVRGSKGLVASDPVWMSSFTINERKVAEYRVGRVFLAGDAAHVHSPAGGQGMNTGMHDAFNLAWKLALVSCGLCNAEPLLTSYCAERSAVAKLVLEATGRATTLALLKGEAKQSIRNHIASLVFGFAPVRHLMANVLSEVAIGYPDSPLNSSRDLEPSAPAPGKRVPVHEGGVVAGCGSAPRFALFAAEDEAHQEIVKDFGDILEPQLCQPFDAKGLWLVRPDGYVALRAKGGDMKAVRDCLNWLRN
jgi:2-polyprenyl-6-methoxyphenol hydroxylase-like FAD-dependent oxidoreductase